MTAITDIVCTPVVTPTSVDAPDAADFVAMIEQLNAACRYDIDSDHLDYEPVTELPSWLDQTDRLQYGLLAREGDRVVGALQVSVPLEQDASNVEFELAISPTHRGRGVAAALMPHVERIAREHGRRLLQTFTVHRADLDGPRLTSPTGFGTLPVEGASSFYLAQGFVLAQVERNSVFELTQPLDRVRAMLDEALAAAGADYRVVSWTCPTPDAFKHDYAFVQSRMSTDAPMGELDWPEERWDAARVERRDANVLAGGQTLSVVAVQHIPSGELVAFNELMIGPDRTRPTHQWSTLVVKAHRGHRLGMVVKCVNILRWRELVPESPFISTFNAEENRPMLDVNEALGFAPFTHTGAWQRELAD